MVPSTMRVPFVYVGFDPSRAFQRALGLNYKVLVVGQRLAAGTKAAGTIDRVTSADYAKQFYGEGSVLAEMFDGWFRNNRFNEVYGYSFDDAGGSVAAAGTIAITGPATASGVFYVYIGGKRLSITVDTGDSATVIGDKIVTAIGSTMLVSAVNTTGSVALTARNKGEVGNDIDIRVNYNTGERMPAGVSAVITPMASGAGVPDFDTLIAAMGDAWFQIIVGAYSDAVNLGKIEAELADRFGPIRQIDGVYICSKRADLSGLQTFGGTRNSPHVNAIHNYGMPTPSFQFAAQAAGQIAFEGSSDPARPFHTLEVRGALPPVNVDRFTTEENNSLLHAGISTFAVDDAGRVRLQGTITMYQKNDAGADDIAYLQLNTVLTLMYLRWDFRTQILTRYNRAKLADDGVNIGAGQQVITPKIGKAEAVSIFRGWEQKGLVENIDQFATDLQCTRNQSDPNRLDWSMSPDLVNQFIVGGAVMQFILQSPEN